MDIRDKRGLKAASAEALSNACYNPQKLALIHAGAALGLSLIITIVNFILTRQIDATGGLAGMTTRSVLSTAQTLLMIGSAVVLPFWEVGFLTASIAFARKNPVGPDTLLSGFRRFWPVFRLQLLRLVLYIVLLIVCVQLATILFILTPLSDGLMNATEAMFNEGVTINEELIASLAPQIAPVYVVFALVFCVVAIPVLYRFRMAEFVMMDKQVGAFRAMGMSHVMMRYNRLSLFKLDLSFWWYYGLQLAITAVGYGDTILAALGINLPISQDVAFFGFFLVHLAGQLLLAVKAQSYVQTTYATAYESLLPEAEDPEPKVIKSSPWDHLPQ